MSEPIRVLHVVGKMHRAGVETRLMDIYRHIDRSQIQFDFLTHRMEDGDYDDEIRSLGGMVYHIPGIKPWNLYGYIRNLNCFFNQHPGYKIIHVHLNAYSGWVQYAAKFAGVPVRITHSRNTGLEINWKMPFKVMSKWIVNGPTTHKFACSYQAGEWLFGEKGILPPNEFRVIPNSFDLSKFSFSDKRRFDMRSALGLKEELAFVHVGRLVPQKNHFFLIEIFSEICKLWNESKLFLIGDGPMADSIKKKARKMGLDGRIIFIGNIPNVYDYLQAMDCMIFPSLFEGFGTVVIESQCCGLPTLASDVLPQETQITKSIEFLSLKDSPKEWAEKAIEMTKSIKRKDSTLLVKQAGYDIEDTFKQLSKFYLAHS